MMFPIKNDDFICWNPVSSLAAAVDCGVHYLRIDCESLIKVVIFHLWVDFEDAFLSAARVPAASSAQASVL
jgi:hypothetical protein